VTTAPLEQWPRDPRAGFPAQRGLCLAAAPLVIELAIRIATDWQERDGDFAPCDEAASPVDVEARGEANVKMKLPAEGALQTRADHTCGAHAPITLGVERTREAYRRHHLPVLRRGRQAAH